MSAALLAMVSTFALVLAVELPDKTLVATLILTTRFRGWPVFTGVCAAFAVQCVVAVLFGGALSMLPENIVAGIVAALFGIGSFLLLRDGFTSARDGTEDASRSGPHSNTFLRAALTSFGVLFVAEWGDASQLATAGMAAKYGQPIAAGVGAFLALVAVAAVAVFVGQKVRSRIRPYLLQRIAGIVFAGLAAYALWSSLS